MTMPKNPSDFDFNPDDHEHDNREHHDQEDDTESPDSQDASEADIDAEILRLQQRADENRRAGRQLGLGLPDEEAATEDLSGQEFLTGLQDPNEAHSLYYSIRRELMNNLPAGAANKELRQFVYDEKNLYLNRGNKPNPVTGIRGSDGRQAYLRHLQNALVETRLWSATGGSAFDAFVMFRELNKNAGFGTTENDGETETPVD